MRDELIRLLRPPSSDRALELVTFESRPRADGSTDVCEGVLFDAATRRAYPVMNGVPALLPASFTRDFLARHREAIARHPTLSARDLEPGTGKVWSFSREWDQHFATGSDRTWGYTPTERLEQLLMETQTAVDWFPGKLVLDAGCGNGDLAEEMSRLGAVVVGLDYASAIRSPECLRRAPDVHFLQGDLQEPPLAAGSFDLAISIGVLHHTPDTLTTFRAVAKLVKPGGRFFVWLYRRPERFAGRYVKVPLYDLARSVVTRLPSAAQDRAVHAYARLVRGVHRAFGRGREIPLREYLVSAYDDLTPRWRHYHTPLEVGRWFHEAGFTAPTLTHWDNPYGFGLVATRDAQPATPGIHYGAGERLWDDKTTILGKLHAD